MGIGGGQEGRKGEGSYFGGGTLRFEEDQFRFHRFAFFE